ncbi:tyrosine-type recombinase/integrase [Paraburkholderia caribensis]|uniref:tyrosine-type recombinase/integrase n=1 Tax=Paraburkholderia caribensis TaxID=75105 RepID=UPI0034D35E75
MAYLEDNDIPLERVAVEDLTNFRNFKLTTGLNGRPSSPRVADQSIRAFKRFWNYGIECGYFIDDGLVPISEYEASKHGYPDDNDIALPIAEDIAAFCSNLRSPEERIASGMGYGAGMRRAEIVGLPADIILPVFEMERASSGAVCLTLDGIRAPTKGGRRRTIEIPVLLYSQMYNYRIGPRRAQRIARTANPPDSLLVSKYGCQYVPGWLNDVCANASSASGITIWPHLLRHWYATRFIEYELLSRFGGSEVKAYRALQRLLGHSSLETTLRYTHIVNNEHSSKARIVSGFQQKLDVLLNSVCA